MPISVFFFQILFCSQFSANDSNTRGIPGPIGIIVEDFLFDISNLPIRPSLLTQRPDLGFIILLFSHFLVDFLTLVFVVARQSRKT